MHHVGQHTHNEQGDEAFQIPRVDKEKGDN